MGELRGLGAETDFVIADVRQENQMSHLIDRTVERFGRLDVAVNDAGTEAKPGPVIDLSAETYTSMFDTNVLGTLLGLKYELRIMQAQGSGSIVNISSTMGERGAANFSLYAGSKHAVEGITKSAAIEAAVSSSTAGLRIGRPPLRRKSVRLAARRNLFLAM